MILKSFPSEFLALGLCLFLYLYQGEKKTTKQKNLFLMNHLNPVNMLLRANKYAPFIENYTIISESII